MGVPDEDSWLLREHYPRATGAPRGWRRAVSIAILGTMLVLVLAGIVAAVA